MNQKTSAVEMRSCATCKFCAVQQLPPPEITKVRVCKRFPPQVNVVQSQQGGAFMVNFPIVADEVWCYEYAPEGAANG